MTTTVPEPADGSPSAGSPVLVGGYTLLSKIGEGGMGIVHLARRGDGPRVALKVLRPHIVGDDEAESYELVFILSAGQDESSTWQEFGEMRFASKEGTKEARTRSWQATATLVPIR